MATAMPFDTNIRESDMLFDVEEPAAALTLEVEAAPAEMIENEDGSVTIELDGPDDPENPDGDDFDVNLAEVISEAELTTIAADLISDIEDDLRSREDWER